MPITNNIVYNIRKRQIFNSTSTKHVQPGKKICTGQFLTFRSGKVPTLNFWKVCTCPLWATFFRSNYLHWRQQKLKRVISQQEKVLSRRLTPLRNSKTKKIIVVRYPFIRLCTYLCLTKHFSCADVSKNIIF